MRKALALLVIAVIALLLPARPALADGPGSADNDGQALIVRFAEPVAIYNGEAGGPTSEALDPRNYAVDGVPLGDGVPGCIQGHVAAYTFFCDTARVLLPDHALVDGRDYAVTFKDQDLGVFTAHGLADLTAPVVLEVDVSQPAIVVRFSKPMRHDGGCPGPSGGTPGSVGFVRGDRPSISSPDGVLEDAIATGLAASMSDDCTAVTLTAFTVFPEGRFTLDVANMEDTLGNELIPARFVIDIADLGAPTLVRGYGARQLDQWSVDLRFDQPLDALTALDPGSYTVDGLPLPADASLTCTEVCANVHLTFAAGSVAAVLVHELTYAGVRDLAGNAPDPLESVFFPAY